MTWQTTILCTGSSLSNHTFLEMNKCISFWDASAYRKSYQNLLKFKWCLYCEWLGRRPFCSGCIEIITSLLSLIDLPAIVYKWRLTCVLSCLLFRWCQDSRDIKARSHYFYIVRDYGRFVINNFTFSHLFLVGVILLVLLFNGWLETHHSHNYPWKFSSALCNFITSR